MSHGTKIVTIFLIISIIGAIVSTILMRWFLTGFEATLQGQIEAVYASPLYGAGIGSGMFASMLLFYPVYISGDRNHEGEDFR